MYLPAQFAAPDDALTLELMRRHPFATLISTDAEGAPFATHLPVVVEAGEKGVRLDFHLARANPHVAMLRAGAPSMLAFLGPNAYLSPTVYPDRQRVPTWNYIAAHAYGRLDEVTTEVDKDALLKSLIALHEPAYAEQWRGLEAAFQRAMLSAIAAFRLTVTRLEGKFKLNQHRPESHAAMLAAYGAGDTDERELAEWLRRLTRA